MALSKVKEKRHPLLIDAWWAEDMDASGPDSPPEVKAYVSRAKNLARGAKRFVFDETSVVYLEQIVRDYPRVIADAHDYAIVPYESVPTWIEMPIGALVSLYERGGWAADHLYESAMYASPQEREAFLRYGAIGFLISAGTVYTAISHNVFDPKQDGQYEIGSVAVRMYCYQLNRPFNDEQQFVDHLDSFRLSREWYERFMWGPSLSTLEQTSREAVEVLTMNHRVVSPFSEQTLAKMGVSRTGVMFGSKHDSGELRLLVAALILLNRSSQLSYRRDIEVKPARRISGHNVEVFHPHKVIRFSLNPIPEVRRLTASAEFLHKRAEHDVKGHLCYNERSRTAACAHGRDVGDRNLDWWEEIIPNQQWRCTQCKGLRWWRRDHKRGDPQVGTITSEYEVVR